MDRNRDMYPSESNRAGIVEDMEAAAGDSQAADKRPSMNNPPSENAPEVEDESFRVDTARRRSSAGNIYEADFDDADNQRPPAEKSKTKKKVDDDAGHAEGHELRSENIEPSALMTRFEQLVDIEGCKCEAFKNIGKFYKANEIELDQQHFSSARNSPKNNTNQRPINPSAKQKQKDQLADDCKKQIKLAMTKKVQIHLKDEEYVPNIADARPHSVLFNQAVCQSLIDATQSKMTDDIELEALSNSTLFQGLKAQFSLQRNADDSGNKLRNTYEFETHDTGIKSGLIYQQDFYLHDGTVYIVVQKSEVHQEEKICQLDVLIFQYGYGTRTCKLIHSKTLSRNADFDQQFSPQKQAFIQNGQYLYYVRIKEQAPERIDNRARRMFVLSRFDLESHQEEYKEIKWQYQEHADKKIPFYVLFFQKFDHICQRTKRQNAETYDTLVLPQPYVDESLFLINQYVMVCYYQPHLNQHSTLRLEYELRNIDSPQKCLHSNIVAPAQFKHQIKALYFNQRAPEEMQGGPQAEFKSEEFLRIEMKGKSDEFEVDESSSKDGTRLLYQEAQRKAAKEENNEAYRKIDDEIKLFRSLADNEDQFPVQIEAITTNINDDLVYKTEYTSNLGQNEQSVQHLLSGCDQPGSRRALSAVNHTQVPKDHNDPDPEDEKDPAPKCLFLKDQISNKLLIIKGYQGGDQSNRHLHKFVILQADLHQNQLVPIEYEAVNQCISKYMKIKTRGRPNQHHGIGHAGKSAKSIEQEFVNDIIKNEELFRPPLLVFRQESQANPQNDQSKDKTKIETEPSQNNTNLYLGKQDFFIRKGPNGEIEKYKIVHNDEFFTSNDETLMPFQIEPYGEEQKKEKKSEDKDQNANQKKKRKDAQKVLQEGKSDNQEDQENQEHQLNLPNKGEGKELRIIPTQNQLKEFDQKEIPLLINSIKYQAYFLALLDLDNRRLIEVRQLDLSKQEFQDSNDPEMIYSSELYLQELQAKDGKPGIVVCQNYHCAITFKNMQRLMLFELLMQWAPVLPKQQKPITKTNSFKPQIKLIGRKDFIASISQENLDKESKFAFIERYQDKNNIVKGIKINVQQYKNEYVSYLIPNIPLEEENIIESGFAYTRYLKAYNQEMLEGIVVSVRLKNKLIQDETFSYYDINQLIRNATKTCLNMIHIDIEDILYREIRFNDVYQSIDVLYGMSVLDLFCGNPQRVQMCLSQTDEPCRQGQLASIIQMLMGNEPSKMARIQSDLSISNMLRAKNEVSFDFNYQSVLQRCMKGPEPQTLTADIILEHVFKQKYNINNQKVLTMLLPHVIQAERQLNHYYQFLGIEVDDYDDNRDNDEYRRLELNIRLKEVDNLPRFSQKEMELQVLNTKGQNPVDDLTDKIRDLVYNSENIGTDYEVEHNYLDFRFLLFNQKIKKILFQHPGEAAGVKLPAAQIQGIDIDIQVHVPTQIKLSQDSEYVDEITEFEIADYMCFIMEAAGGKIAQFQIIRSIIDEQFALTREHFFREMLCYLVGYMAPFLMQIFEIGMVGEIACLGICAATLLYFFRQETVQIQDQGVAYVTDIWNFFDLTGFAVFVALIFIRLLHLDKHTPIIYTDEDEVEADTIERSIRLKLLCSYLLFQAFIKILFFLRIFESFGQLVQLIAQCLQDVQQFMQFMFSWIIVFWIQYLILGMEVDPADYGGLEYVLRTFIQSWRNSIGDGAAPQYYKYRGLPSEVGMAAAIWVIWVLHQILILIMLLNFLIAVISQSYEKVQSQSVANRYMHRSQLNRECRLLCRGALRPIDILVFSVAKERTEKDDWEGFVTTIKAFVNRASQSIREKFSKDLQSQLAANQRFQCERIEMLEQELEQQEDLTREMSQQLDQIFSIVSGQGDRKGLLTKTLGF